MRNVLLALAILIGSLSTADAQTPLLQALIDQTPAGGTLTLPSDVVYSCTCVISKSIRLQSAGIRSVVGAHGQTFLVGAKVISPNADPALWVLPGVDGVSIQGIEATHIGAIHDVVRIGSTGSGQDATEEEPRNITLNNIWIHGLSDQESQRGVSANGKFITITNSRIDEIHGRGYDTQAICVWNGSGPFLITDNYLSGSGENVMFGGAPPSIPGLVPTDIQFRRNEVVKPLSWYVNDPSYAGIHWTVKNLFELKNARRATVDGNTFSGNWTDAQAGRSIVFTPRPSDSGPAAIVEDVTFSNNTVRNVGSGVLILGMDDGYTVNQLRRLKIVNNLFFIDGPRFISNGAFLTVINNTQDVTADHNTAIQTGNILISDYVPNARFTYTNNIARHNEYGVIGSGHSIGNDSINYYFPGALFVANVIAKEFNSPWNVDLIYPAGNYFPGSLSAVGFADLAGGDYRLGPFSPYKGAGTNGSDPGCDIDALIAAQGGAIAVPTPSPTPVSTATPTPTPTPTATPAPSPSPNPSPSPLTDTTRPTVTITSPAVGASVSGTITINANASDNVGVDSTYLIVDGIVAGFDGTSPYSFNLDTTKLVDGSHMLYVRAWDAAGNAGDSLTISFTVANSAQPSPTPTPIPSPLPSPSPTPSPTPQCRKFNPKGKCIQWF